MSQTAWSPHELFHTWVEAVESSSRFATYVAFGLFCAAILVSIIGMHFDRCYILSVCWARIVWRLLLQFLDNQCIHGVFLADRWFYRRYS